MPFTTYAACKVDANPFTPSDFTGALSASRQNVQSLTAAVPNILRNLNDITDNTGYVAFAVPEGVGDIVEVDVIEDDDATVIHHQDLRNDYERQVHDINIQGIPDAGYSITYKVWASKAAVAYSATFEQASIIEIITAVAGLTGKELPIDYPLDDVFRLAGFPYGRPKGNAPSGYVETMAGSWELMSFLFSGEMIDTLVRRVSEQEGVAIPRQGRVSSAKFDYFLASYLLETVIEGGYTPTARPLDTQSVTIGDMTVNYDLRESVAGSFLNTARRLRIRADNMSEDADDNPEIQTVVISRR